MIDDSKQMINIGCLDGSMVRIAPFKEISRVHITARVINLVDIDHNVN